MGDDFYRSKDPTNSIKVLKEEEATKKNLEKLNNKIHTQIRNSTRYKKIQHVQHTTSPLV